MNNMMELQNILLGIYREFKTICDEHRLNYFAIGGTCLGAVRHKGFIPWDDDMDIGMPREDLNEFVGLAKMKLPDFLEIRFIKSKINRIDFYIARIYDKRTTLVHNYAEKYFDLYGGVYIDIMPIDSIPNDKFSRKLFFQKTKLLRYFDLRQKFDLKYFDGNYKGKLLAILLTPTKIFPKDFFMTKYVNLVSKYSFYNKEYRSFSFLWSYRADKMIFSKSLFYDLVNVQFEDTYIYCPANYDQYLKKHYGDYSKLPSKEEQVPTVKDEVLLLNQEYNKYIEEIKIYEKK